MKKVKYTLKERLHYIFDNIMARGTIALIGWLALLTMIITLVVTLAAWIIGAVFADNFPDQLWRAVMFTITLFDPTEGYDWGPRIALFFILIVGIFATSTLIGLLTTGIESKIENMRKGRSRVIEKDHTIILGWNPMIFSIITELVKAYTNRGNVSIVILAARDKVEMEEEIYDKIGAPRHIKIVCRTGSPMEITDLGIVGINQARSVILLHSLDEPGDAGIIKTLLAITRNPARQKGKYHLVSEIADPRNLEIAKIISKDEVELVSANEFISRIMAQTCRQSGLSVVYTELFQFEGDEIYLKTEPELAGLTFEDALFSYRKCAVIGINSPTEGIVLNPPLERKISMEDQLIAITKDDSTFVCDTIKKPVIDIDSILNKKEQSIKPVNILILGWNDRVLTIVAELDYYLAKGSRVKIIAESDERAELKKKYKNIKKVEFALGDTTHRELLESQDLGNIDHIILLPYSGVYNEKQADARTLNTLLHLRDLGNLHEYRFSIVSEMLDVRNRELAEADRSDDFVVSDSLISMVLAQVSGNKALAPIFSILLNPGGVEIYLRPAELYIKTGICLNFYTIVEAASRKREIAIGYRINAEKNESEQKYGVYLNPDKEAMISLSEEDKIIVIAEV